MRRLLPSLQGSWRPCALVAGSLLVSLQAASTQKQAAHTVSTPAAAPRPPDAAATLAPAALVQAMTRIAAGRYRPFYRPRDGRPDLEVPEFWLDAAPVSCQSFARFVSARPDWQRSRVPRLFAEPTYLGDWRDDETPGEGTGAEPVQLVSWFAAKAYCAWQNKRLPSVVEWEHALGARDSPGRNAPPVAAPALWEWALDFNSVPVAAGGDGDAGGNSFCGAGARARDATDYTAFLRFAYRSSLKASYTLRRLGFRCANGTAP